MADFEKRGFRCTRPESRNILERHATAFLTGFNLAVRHWRDPHAALAEVPAAERGFAYEGAAMYASLRDLASPGRRPSVDRLLDPPGDGYIHLIHVGAGWTLAPLRLPLPRLPRTPLLRWLALDGAGFAETFFGGTAALRRRCRRRPGPRWEAQVAGCGRALWFVESADVDAVARVVAAQPAAAQPHLWSGVGLACGYAGAVNERERTRLAGLAGRHQYHLRQGVAFAVGARHRSTVVPQHTVDACQQLLGTDVETATGWTDQTAARLDPAGGLNDYLEWKARIRELVADYPLIPEHQ
ncbi:DUF1702 family protein [Micromonospora sp. LOL_021]|uniref:DUF1702 family protein n=1 Tax=Micromonospora sp. LOL_021 TaxID=3345417 RepID=UPI003A84F4CB